MTKKKIAIAISDWLLEELDDRASVSHVSRSSLVEEAVTEYVASRNRQEVSESKREAASAALNDMRLFAREYAGDPQAALEPAALEKLRSLRAQGRGL